MVNIVLNDISKPLVTALISAGTLFHIKALIYVKDGFIQFMTAFGIDNLSLLNDLSCHDILSPAEF